MPQLPSGRHVAVSGRRFTDDSWDDFAHVHTLEDLAPYITIELFRDATVFDQHRIATRSPLVRQSNQPPADQVLYDSGYSLADFESLIADWNDEDAAALREFIASDRFRTYLHDTLRQILLATEQVEPTLVDVVLYHPPTRELFERNDD
jgi:hypothetical protein